MRLTDVKVTKIENVGSTKAIASIVFDDAICVRDIRVVEGKMGLLISFPKQKRRDGLVDVAHTINSETREKIQNAILEEYKQIN